MKRFLIMGLALIAGAAFAQVGPQPVATASGAQKIVLPFADVQIKSITNFRLSYEESDGYKYVWLHFTAVLKPVSERVLLNDFMGQATLRDPQTASKITRIDSDGNPVVSMKYDELPLGSYRVADGQTFQLAPAENTKELVIGLGPIAGPDDKINAGTREKLIKLFNIFANGRSKGGYEMQLTGKAKPGVLGDNGAWVFLQNAVNYVWMFDMSGPSISYPVKALEAK